MSVMQRPQILPETLLWEGAELREPVLAITVWGHCYREWKIDAN